MLTSSTASSGWRPTPHINQCTGFFCPKSSSNRKSQLSNDAAGHSTKLKRGEDDPRRQNQNTQRSKEKNNKENFQNVTMICIAQYTPRLQRNPDNTFQKVKINNIPNMTDLTAWNIAATASRSLECKTNWVTRTSASLRRASSLWRA